jgi:hypothetical protein
VASRSSVQRAFKALGPVELSRLAGARAAARSAVWDAGAGPDGNEAIIDVDATIVWTRRTANIGFSLGYWIDHRVRDALLLVQEEDWEPAGELGGQRRDGAQVVEITDLVNLDAWPDRTRLIVRRERLHQHT